MTKNEFFKYLPNFTSGIFTTVRADGIPEGRGFEYEFEKDGNIYFYTAHTKDVYQELEANPVAAFTYMEPTGKFTVRINGKVGFITDTEEKKALWEKLDPVVQKMYKTWDNPIGEWICIEKPEMKLSIGFGEAKTVE